MVSYMSYFNIEAPMPPMASLAILASLVPRPSDPIVSFAPLLSLDPQVPPALILQHLVAVANLQPSLKKQAQKCHWKKVLLLSGPKIGKAYSPLFTHGSPWPHSPLAPLVPPALSLQHLVAAPTLTQETSTKLSLVMRWPFVKQPALVCARAHFYPN